MLRHRLRLGCSRPIPPGSPQALGARLSQRRGGWPPCPCRLLPRPAAPQRGRGGGRVTSRTQGCRHPVQKLFHRDLMLTELTAKLKGIDTVVGLCTYLPDQLQTLAVKTCKTKTLFSQIVPTNKFHVAYFLLLLCTHRTIGECGSIWQVLPSASKHLVGSCCNRCLCRLHTSI